MVLTRNKRKNRLTQHMRVVGGSRRAIQLRQLARFLRLRPQEHFLLDGDFGVRETELRQLAWFLRLRPQGRFLLDGDFGVPEREPPSGATIVRSQRPTMRVVEYLEARS